MPREKTAFRKKKQTNKQPTIKKAGTIYTEFSPKEGKKCTFLLLFLQNSSLETVLNKQLSFLLLLFFFSSDSLLFHFHLRAFPFSHRSRLCRTRIYIFLCPSQIKTLVSTQTVYLWFFSRWKYMQKRLYASFKMKYYRFSCDDVSFYLIRNIWFRHFFMKQFVWFSCVFRFF